MMYIYIYIVCMYACMHVCMYVCMYIYNVYICNQLNNVPRSKDDVFHFIWLMVILPTIPKSRWGYKSEKMSPVPPFDCGLVRYILFLTMGHMALS